MGKHDIRAMERTGGKASAGNVRFEVLDSWRGICALLVALFHLPLAGPIGENSFVRGSFLFVDFFFVLSGFVIAHSYSARVGNLDDAKRFMITRFGRLFPLHAFMLAAFVGFELVRMLVPQLAGGQTPLTGAFALETLPANLALVHGLGFEDHLSWNAPSWSISTELFAYVFFAIVMLALGGRAWMAFLAMVIAGPVLLFRLSPDFMDATYDFGLLRCLFGFSAGVLTQRLLHGKISAGAMTRAERAVWTASELIVMGALALFVSTSADNAGGLLAPFIFAFAVALFAHEGGYVSQILRMRPFLTLGAISYSIYLTHIFVQGRMLNAAKVLDNRLGTEILAQGADGSVFSQSIAPWAVFAMIAITVCVSLVTYRLVEVPGRDLFKRLALRSNISVQTSQTRPYGASTSS